MTKSEFLTKCADIEKGWMLASLTDDYIVDDWPSSVELDENKLLELRVFNEHCEHKLFRSAIDYDFDERTISDKDYDDHFDEIHYLDIDTTKGIDDGKVTTTGGGQYKLPRKFNKDNINNARVKIRYYLGRYPKTGQARVEDWRVVEFL